MTTTTTLTTTPAGTGVVAVAPETGALRLLSPVASPAQMIDAQNAVRAFVADVLREGQDYGKIPGTNKPTLLKPGAEKLASGFGLTVSSSVVDSEVDHEREVRWVKRQKQWEGAPGHRRQVGEKVTEGVSLGLYRYVVRVDLIDQHGVVRGSGLGACSTLESKYADRPRECENTVLKMAFKRAQIAATLTTLGMSEAFTQDVEDMSVVSERTEQPPEAFPMPFGPTKMTPIGEVETEDLRGACEWAESKGKFEEFQEAARAVLRARDTAAPPPAEDKSDHPDGVVRGSASDAPTMPFGPTKGTPLSEMDTDDLKGALKWAFANNKSKWEDFLSAGREELRRRKEESEPDLNDFPEGGDDDLPF